MPFTVSDPAIVLPLAYLPNKWFSLSGLIIGSLAPDFEYFLRMKIAGHHSHTVAGLFWFDLPISILLAFVYHTIVRHNLLNNLPTFLRSRLIVFDSFTWNAYFVRNWPVVLISVLIGAASHLFRDSFTHESGYFVHAFPALETIRLNGIPLHKVLQHGSTLTGVLVLFLVILKLSADHKTPKEINLNYWMIVAGIMLLATGIRLMFPFHGIGTIVVTLLSAGMIGLILAPAILRVIALKPFPGEIE